MAGAAGLARQRRCPWHAGHARSGSHTGRISGIAGGCGAAHGSTSSVWPGAGPGATAAGLPAAAAVTRVASAFLNA